MDVQAITQIISNLGFPIACCVYLALSNDKLRGTIEENTKTIASLEKIISMYFLKEGANENGSKQSNI